MFSFVPPFTASIPVAKFVPNLPTLTALRFEAI